MAGNILHCFLSEIFVIHLNVKFSFENKLPGHHTHLLQRESLENWNPSKNWATPTEEVATTVLYSVYGQNKFKGRSINELVQSHTV
jgi:hypothetical protein